MDGQFLTMRISALVVTAAAVYMCVRYGTAALIDLLHRQERWYERVLVHQLLIDIHPRTAVVMSIGAVVITGLIGYLLLGGVMWFVVFAAMGGILPYLYIRHLEQKREERLESQLIDGITILASGVRAGLNLIQAMQLLTANLTGPIKQEFDQLLREYELGVDLNQAMRNAANRIGRQNYRLLFTAIEMHRQRGGDSGESLDRIADSIREIQRLEGKLDALTAQGRSQARMMAVMPFVILGIFYLIAPGDVTLLFTEPIGRGILVVALLLIIVGFTWIRRIMEVDI